MIIAMKGIKTLFYRQNGILAWIICSGMFICNVIYNGIDNAFGVFLGQIVSDFNSDRESVAWIASIHSSTLCLAGFICAVLSNWFSFRLLIFVGGVVSYIAFLAAYFSCSILTLTLTYGLLGGLGTGIIYTPGLIACGFYFDDRRRALATGIATSGQGVGLVVIPLAVNYINGKYGWRESMLFFTSISPIICLVALVMLPVHSTSSDNTEISPNEDIARAEDSVNGNDIQNTVSKGKVTDKNTASSKNTELSLNQDIVRVEDSDNDKDIQKTVSKEEVTDRDTVSNNNTEISLDRDIVAVEDSVNDNDIQNPVSKEKVIDKEKVNGSFETQHSVPVPRVSIYDICAKWKLKATQFFIHYWELLKKPKLLSYCFSQGLYALGYFIPINFLPDMMVQDHGISSENAGNIIPIIGAATSIGKIMTGLLMAKFKLNPLALTSVYLLGCGIFSVSFLFCTHYSGFVVVGALYGLVLGPIEMLIMECLTEMFGIKLVKDTIGFIMIVYAIGALIGAPFAGWFFDIFHNYNASFYCCAMIYLVSALSGCIALFLNKKG